MRRACVLTLTLILCALLVACGGETSDDDSDAADQPAATTAATKAPTEALEPTDEPEPTATEAPADEPTEAAPVETEAAATEAPAEASGPPLTFEVSRQREEVVIGNGSDQPLDVSGWTVVSVKGDQRYVIPAGTVIAPGDTLMITSADNMTGDLHWSNENIWNNEGDPAQLLDASGAEVATG